MNKLRLRDKVDLAWFKEHGEPGGWDKYITAIDEGVSQRKRAALFGVAPETMWRWDQERKQEVVNG